MILAGTRARRAVISSIACLLLVQMAPTSPASTRRASRQIEKAYTTGAVRIGDVVYGLDSIDFRRRPGENLAEIEILDVTGLPVAVVLSGVVEKLFVCGRTTERLQLTPGEKWLSATPYAGACEGGPFSLPVSGIVRVTFYTDE